MQVTARVDYAVRALLELTTSPEGRLTAEALFWFSFSLPFSGFVLMLTRGFFALQRPWVPTTLAVTTPTPPAHPASPTPTASSASTC